MCIYICYIIYTSIYILCYYVYIYIIYVYKWRCVGACSQSIKENCQRLLRRS